MLLLEPRGRLRRAMLGSQQVINVLTEGGIGQHALELVPRDRLQDNPRVPREFPECRIKQPPHFVGAMIPRPAHIQGQLGQGVESLDFRRQKAVCRVADTGLSFHGFSSGFARLAATLTRCTVFVNPVSGSSRVRSLIVLQRLRPGAVEGFFGMGCVIH